MSQHEFKDKADSDSDRFSGRLNVEPQHRDSSSDLTDYSEYPPMPEAPSQKYDK